MWVPNLHYLDFAQGKNITGLQENLPKIKVFRLPPPNEADIEKYFIYVIIIAQLIVDYFTLSNFPHYKNQMKKLLWAYLQLLLDSHSHKKAMP